MQTKCIIFGEALRIRVKKLKQNLRENYLKSTKTAITACKCSKFFQGSMPPDPLELSCFSISFKVVMPNKKIEKMWKLWPLLKFFAAALLHLYFRYKTGHLKTCRRFFALRRKTGHLRMCKPFFCFLIRATLTIVVVEDIELDPFNNPAREGLRLPTCGQPTKEVAHPAL